MQRHRDDEQFESAFGSEPSNRVSQTLSQASRGWTETVIFQRVKGFPQTPLIGTNRNGAHKRRGSEAASAAKICLGWGQRRRVRRKHVATADTAFGGMARDFSPAGSTDWNGGKAREGRSAKRAECRKKGTTHGIHGTSENTRYGAPAGSLRGGEVGRQRTEVTAEDTPHSRGSGKHRHKFSIASKWNCSKFKEWAGNPRWGGAREGKRGTGQRRGFIASPPSRQSTRSTRSEKTGGAGFGPRRHGLEGCVGGWGSPARTVVARAGVH